MGKKQNQTMRVRTKDEIRQSMVDKGIIDVKGNVNETVMVKNATKTTVESKETIKATSKSKTKKTARKSTKSVLILENVNGFDQKVKLFDKAMVDFYGTQYDTERGTVKFNRESDKPFYVNVQVQEMKIRSDRSTNTTGLRVFMFKNGSSYTIGEYAGKISIDRIAKRIQIIADSEMGK